MQRFRRIVFSIFFIFFTFVSLSFAQESIYKEKTGFHFLKGRFSLKEQKWNEAINEFKEAIKTNPFNVGAHQNLGVVYACKKMYDEAIDKFNQALKMKISQEDAAVLYFNKGSVYYAKGLVKEAKDNFEKANNIIGNFIPANILLAGVISAEQTGNTASFTFSANASPLPDTAFFVSLETLGKHKIYVLNDSTFIPLFFYHSPLAYFSTGTSYFHNGKIEEAKELFGRVFTAIDLHQRTDLDKIAEWGACYFLGKISLKEKDYSRAVEMFKKGTEIDENIAVLHDFLALSCFLDGNHSQAKTECEYALKLNPDSKYAKEILIRLKGE